MNKVMAHASLIMTKSSRNMKMIKEAVVSGLCRIKLMKRVTNAMETKIIMQFFIIKLSIMATTFHLNLPRKMLKNALQKIL